MQMKFLYQFISYIILCHSIQGFAQEDKSKSTILMTSDAIKSLYHLHTGGYSIDLGVFYIFPKKTSLSISCTFGNTKYYRKEITHKNIINYTIKGSYINPQINFKVFSREKYSLFIGVGLLMTEFDEELAPHIPAKYFQPFIGDVIKRSNMNTTGFDLDLTYWFLKDARLSFMLTGKMAWVAYPKVPSNILVDQLELQYIPGVGKPLGSAESTSVLAFNLGAKIVYKLSGL